jgi:RES domain-containing protein
MLKAHALPAVLQHTPPVAVHGPWWRSIAFHYLLSNPSEPLWSAGSKIEGARFTPKGSFDSLYLSWHPITTLAEVNGLVMLPSGPVPQQTPPLTLFVIQGIVTRVLDLTNPSILDALGTSEQEVAGPWVKMAKPPTQILAQAAYESGIFAAVQYHSAKAGGEKNLVVFPDRFKAPAPDFLEVYDSFGDLRQRLGT